MPAHLRGGFAALARGGYGAWPKLGPHDIPPWVAPAFAREQEWAARARANIRESSRYPLERSFCAYWLRTSAGDWSSWYLGAPHGIRNTSPFLDPRVMTVCLGLPRQVKEVPGRSKPVLSDAMRGRLPDSIRLRRLKGHFNAVYWKGLARHLSRLEAMIRRSPINDMGILDTNRLIGCMRQHALGIGDAVAGGRINSTMSLIAWLEQLETPATTSRDPVPMRRAAGPTVA